MSGAPYGEMRSCETPDERWVRLANEARAVSGLPPLDDAETKQLLATVAGFKRPAP